MMHRREKEIKGHHRRLKTKPFNTLIKAHVLSVLFLFCFGPVTENPSFSHVFVSAFSGISVQAHPSHSASNNSPPYKTALVQPTDNCEDVGLPRFRPSTARFMRSRNIFQKREHYNEALLNRIISGRTSQCPLWRKRTKRAAATLGIQRNHRTEQDYRDEQENLYKEILTNRPSVPPPTSTLSATATTSSPISEPIGKAIPKLEIVTFSKRKQKLTQKQHDEAKLEWAAKYTSIHTLRQNFGRNRNKLWGDFDVKTTRKLYHTLLPRALLGLYEVGLWSPKDLAPLAFEARVAAKKYARERCILPGRVAAMAYDGFRSWRQWGQWSASGMSWEQVWDKYESQILEEYMEENTHVDIDELQEEITAQICLRILERSCITNEAVDKMFLDDEFSTSEGKVNKRRRNANRDLVKIKSKLDKDMQDLLEANKAIENASSKNRFPFYLNILGGSFEQNLSIQDLWQISTR